MLIEALESTIELLMKSVASFERFDAKFADLKTDDAAKREGESDQVETGLIK